MRQNQKTKIARSHNRAFITVLYCAGILLAALQVTSISAEPVELRWKSVEGSSGYLVRVEREDGTVTENRIGTNRVRLDLTPGAYVIRIAGLNKFGKPGPFSDPARVQIEKSDKTRTIQMEEVREQTADKEEEPEEPETSYDYRHITYPLALIPGWIQYNRGEEYKLYLYNALILGTAYAFQVERQRGNLLSREPWNDPTNILLASNGNRAFLGLMWFRRSAERSKYSESQNNQTYLAASAGLIYLFHFVDLYYFSDPGQVNDAKRPGRSDWQVGLKVSGSPHSPGSRASWRPDSNPGSISPDAMARIQWRMYF